MRNGFKNSMLMLVFLILCVDIHAQTRVGVLDFKAGVGVSQGDVDGISAIFTTYFISPQNFILVERNQIEQVIQEQGFQRSALTNNDITRIGQILNLQKIIVGDVNDINGEYNVDVRIVDVETGSIQATDGATWSKGVSYRELMKTLATRLITTLTAPALVTHSLNSEPSTSSTEEVFVLYGYLKVFPKDLGVFDSAPNSVIFYLNRNETYGYADWRIPNNEEMSLILSNKDIVRGLGSGPYITSDGVQKGSLRLVSTGDPVAEQNRSTPTINNGNVTGADIQKIIVEDSYLIDEKLKSTIYINDYSSILAGCKTYKIIEQELSPIYDHLESEYKKQQEQFARKQEEYRANPNDMLKQELSNLMNAIEEYKARYTDLLTKKQNELLAPVKAFFKDRIMNLIKSEKCAYIDGNAIWAQRVENDVNIKNELTLLQNQYSEELKRVGDVFNKKLQEYEMYAHGWPSEYKKTRRQELENLKSRIVAYEKEANLLFQKRQEELMIPVREKLLSDIERTAQNFGYAHIIDKALLEELGMTESSLMDISEMITQ